MDVTFFLPEPDLDRLARLQPDRDWREFVTGGRAWTLQTFLRLRERGDPVTLSATLPDEGLVVFSNTHRRELRLPRRGIPRRVLVGTRQDQLPIRSADYEVLQTRRGCNSRTRHFMPHWPQPGLVARDPTRGARVERLAFKGLSANLHPALAAPDWRAHLASRGLEWVADATEFRGSATDRYALDWPDYHDVDLIVALRPPGRHFNRSKPPTKLFNAWLAGVPAILGPERAYRDLREGPLDYIEATDVAGVERAIARLVQDGDLYRAMVEHGRRRAQEFTAEATAARWSRLLFEVLPAAADRPAARLRRRLPLPLRKALGGVATLAQR